MTETAFDFSESPVDRAHLRRALGRFATGVLIATTCTPEKRFEGLTANSFSAVSLDPPLVLWTLQRNAPSLAGFLAAGRFALSVLSAHQQALSRHFATPAPDKFVGMRFEPGLGGCPLIAESIATFECLTDAVHEGGDHIIFIGRVERMRYRDGRPLIFAAGCYGVPAPLAEPQPAPSSCDCRVDASQGIPS